MSTLIGKEMDGHDIADRFDNFLKSHRVLTNKNQSTSTSTKSSRLLSDHVLILPVNKTAIFILFI